MVALLSECYKNDNITSTSNSNNLDINKNDEQKKLEPKPESSQNEYADIPKSLKSELLNKYDSNSDIQSSDLTDYVEYLEKLVVDYKNYIEERFNKVNDQKYKVIENFESGGMGGKSMNDLLIYIITCVFVLLLVDYIFKMGKNTY